MSRSPVTRRRGPFANVRPSYLVLLTAAPFVVYLFLTADSYQRALKFIAPGVGTTILVTVVAYVAASLLGLVLAGLQMLRLGKRTVLGYAVAASLLLLAGMAFFTRPHVNYSLVGSEGGLVAIIRGTPQSLSDTIRRSEYPNAAEPLSVRAVTDVAAAIERLESGVVVAAFLPSESVPPGYRIIWEAGFLPPNVRGAAILFTVFGAFAAALAVAAYSSGHHPLRIVAELYVDLMRGIPMLVVILYVGFPLQGAIREATGGFIDMSRVTRGIVGISLGYAAYMAEIFRAGIEAVSSGQIEASRSLGLSNWQTARHVVLPQALRIVVPPLGNEFIAMLKDTSLLSVLSVRDITQRAREFQASTFEVFPPFNTVAVMYIVLTLMASSLAKTAERRSRWTR